LIFELSTIQSPKSTIGRINPQYPHLFVVENVVEKPNVSHRCGKNLCFCFEFFAFFYQKETEMVKKRHFTMKNQFFLKMITSALYPHYFKR